MEIGINLSPIQLQPLKVKDEEEKEDVIVEEQSEVIADDDTTTEQDLEYTFTGDDIVAMHNKILLDLQSAPAAVGTEDEEDIIVGKSEVLEYIDNKIEELRTELKEKYGYSDEFIDSILQFAKSSLNISTSDYSREFLERRLNMNKAEMEIYNWDSIVMCLPNGEEFEITKDTTMDIFDDLLRNEFNLKEIVDTFQTNIDELLKKPDFHSYADNGEDCFSSDSIVKYNPYHLICDIESTKSDNIQFRYFVELFNNKFEEKNLTCKEKDSFLNIIFKEIYIKTGTEKDRIDYYINNDILAKLDQNGDGTWLDEMFDIVNSKWEELDIQHILDKDVNSASSIDIDIMFANGDNYTAKYIIENLHEMALSNDAGMRKFAQSIETLYDKLPPVYRNYISEEQYLSAIIQSVNEEYGITNSTPPQLTKEAISKLNSDGIFDRIDEISKSYVVFKNMIKSDINSKIDDFSQGSIGDCWLLAGLQALNSTEEGQKIISQQVTWVESTQSVSVYFAGEDKYINITLDEILDAVESGIGAEYDIDVLVLELAMKKLIGEIELDKSRTFWRAFLGDYSTGWDMGMGLDDLGNFFAGLFTGKGGRQDMGKDDVKDFLNKIYNRK